MLSGVVVLFEYAQAFLILIYYWIKALGRLLVVQNLRKNVENEIILITGAGLLFKKRIILIWISF
jgi:hypothetical protein